MTNNQKICDLFHTIYGFAADGEDAAECHKPNVGLLLKCIEEIERLTARLRAELRETVQ